MSLSYQEEQVEMKSLLFNGTSDYVDCGNDPSLSITGDLTIELWFNLTDNVHGKSILSKFYNAEYELTLWGSNICYFNGPNYSHGNYFKCYDFAFQPNQWYHLAVARKGDTRTVTFYVNGENVGEFSCKDEAPSTNEFLYLGRRKDGLYFAGQIAEVRIWNNLRGVEEINADMNCLLSGNEPGLAGYWSFRQPAEDHVPDLSPNNNSGILKGSPTWVDNTGVLLTQLTEISNDFQEVETGLGTLAFAGGQSYMDCGNIPGLSITGDLTVEAWVFPTGDLHGECLVSKHYNGEFDLAFWNGRLVYKNGPQYHAGNHFNPDFIFETHQWYHVALARAAATRKVTLYVNGRQVDDYQYADTPPVTGNNLCIGARPGGHNPFIGKIADVRIWNTVRGGDEISNGMNRFLNGDESGLVAYWGFNEKPGATVNDLSANGYEAALIGNPQWDIDSGVVMVKLEEIPETPVGEGPGALEFDGRGAYVDCGNKAPLSITGDLTIEAWVRPTGPLHRECLLSKHHDGELDLVFWDGRLDYKHGPRYNAGNHFRPAFIFQAGQWYHIAVTRDSAARQVALHVNGRKIDHFQYNDTPPSTTHNLCIGARHGGLEPFTGIISEVRIWNTLRSGEEIRQAANLSLTGSEPGLAALWNFEEKEGTAANDLTPNGCHGALQGNPLWVAGPEVTPPPVTDLPEPEPLQTVLMEMRAMEFDGQGDHIHCGNDTSLSITGDLTIEMWVYPTGSLNGETILSKFYDAEYQLTFWGNSIVYSNGPDYRNGNNPKCGNYTFQPNQWYHLAIARDDAARMITLYVNGDYADQNQYTDEPPSSGEILYIGQRKGGNCFQGRIAEVRIWNKVRGAEEINADMIRLLSGNEPGLAGYWNFRRQVEGHVPDLSPNNNHGTAEGQRTWIADTGVTLEKVTAISEPELVLQLSMESVTNNTVRDGSGNELHATVHGNPKVVADPIFGHCMRFNGESDGLSIPAHDKLNVSAYTVAFWIKPEEVPGRVLTGLAGKTGGNFNAWLSDGGSIHHRYRIAGGTDWGIPDTAPGSISWNRWHHVVITNDGDTARTYINGIPVREAPAGGMPDTGHSPLYIGKNLDGAPGGYFKGRMARLYIYNGALPQGVIDTFMLRPQIAPAAGQPLEVTGTPVTPGFQRTGIIGADGPGGTADLTISAPGNHNCTGGKLSIWARGDLGDNSKNIDIFIDNERILTVTPCRQGSQWGLREIELDITTYIRDKSQFTLKGTASQAVSAVPAGMNHPWELQFVIEHDPRPHIHLPLDEILENNRVAVNSDKDLNVTLHGNPAIETEYGYGKCMKFDGIDDYVEITPSSEEPFPAPALEAEFWYHMYGWQMGTLSLECFDGNTWHTAWSISGQQHTSSTDAWTYVSVDLSAYTVKKIRFKGVTGSGSKGDMAIADVIVRTVADRVVQLREDFASLYCSLSSIAGFDGPGWRRNSRSTVSLNTGPSESRSRSGYYAYVEASAPNHPEKTFYLESDILPQGRLLGDCTVTAWIKATTESRWNPAINVGGGALWLVYRGSNLIASGNLGNWQCSRSHVNTQWYHVAVVLHNNDCRLYLDGQERANCCSVVALAASEGIIKIGAGFGKYFQGHIGNVHIYPRALTLDEILEMTVQTDAPFQFNLNLQHIPSLGQPASTVRFPPPQIPDNGILPVEANPHPVAVHGNYQLLRDEIFDCYMGFDGSSTYLDIDCLDEDALMIQSIDITYRIVESNVGSLELLYYDGALWNKVWERSEACGRCSENVDLSAYNIKKLRFTGVGRVGDMSGPLMECFNILVFSYNIVAKPNQLTRENEFACKAWIKTVYRAGWNPIIDIGGGSYRFGLLDNRLTIQGGWGSATADNILYENIWHHVALLVQNQVYKLYLDGVEIASGAAAGLPPDLQEAKISACDDAYFDGDMAQFELYDGMVTTISENREYIRTRLRGTARESFNTDHPMDFDFIDDGELNLLYISNESTLNTFQVEIMNRSGQAVEIRPVRDEQTNDVITRENDWLPPEAGPLHHYELRFRPKTFEAKLFAGTYRYLRGLTLPDNWVVSAVLKHDLGKISIYLLYQGEDAFTLDAGKSLVFTFQYGSADGEKGSRNTIVELAYQNIYYLQEITDLSDVYIKTVDIVNQRGKKNLPLHVAVVGSNAILNDSSATAAAGDTTTSLIIRMVNKMEEDPDNPEKSWIFFNTGFGQGDSRNTQFTILFDDPVDTQWDLANPTDIRAIRIEYKHSGSTSWADLPTPWSGQEENPVRVFNPPVPHLEAGEAIDLRLSNISTGYPSGLANIYIKYEDIPGYWDGYFMVQVEKSPIVHRDVDGKKNVGIGVAPYSSTELKHVRLRVDGDTKINGHLHAKKFFDISNSDYFLTPQSTSSLNSLTASTLTVTGSSTLGSISGTSLSITGSSTLGSISGNLKVAGNVGIGEGDADPVRTLDLGYDGQITFGEGVTSDSEAGIYWNEGVGYGIYRTQGSWDEPDYQQLKIRWDAGIILNPGSNWGAKCYVDVQGKLNVTGPEGSDPENPSDTLEVNGNTMLWGSIKMDAKEDSTWEIYTMVEKGIISSSGEIKKQRLIIKFNQTDMVYLSRFSGGWNTPSDRNLKKDITALPPVLEKVLELKPSTFRLKDAPDKSPKQLGFIAQEVEEQFPELVNEAEGEKSLNYDNFGVLAVAAIKEQHQLLEGQRQMIESQQEIIKRMQKDIEELKALAAKK